MLRPADYSNEMSASVSRLRGNIRECFARAPNLRKCDWIAGIFSKSVALKTTVETLLGGQRHDAILLLDHLAHVADAARALGLALVGGEDMRGFAGAGIDGRAHVSLTDAVAIADVHERHLF
jgi:hypothetical protein